MHYSTEWIVILFIVLVFAAVVYQAYLAGHLILVAIMLPVTLALMYGVNRWTGR